MENVYKDEDHQVKLMISAFEIFKDNPVGLEIIIKGHIHSIFLDGKIAGIEEVAEKLNG